MSRGLGAMQREILTAYRGAEPVPFSAIHDELPRCSVRRLRRAVAETRGQRETRPFRVAFSRALRRLVEGGWLVAADKNGSPLAFRLWRHIRWLQLDPAQWPDSPHLTDRDSRIANRRVAEGNCSTLNQHLEGAVRIYNASAQEWQTIPEPDRAANAAYWQAFLEDSVRRREEQQSR